MSVSLLSSDPSSDSTDFYLNKSIKLNFDEEIDFDSVNSGVISLIDSGSGLSVPLTFSKNSVDPNQIIIIPNTLLNENTTYRVTIKGADIGLPTFLKSKLSNLASSIVFSFRTGDNIYDIDQEISKQANSITLEGDLFLPSNVEAIGLDLNIVSSSQPNRTNNIPVNLGGNNTLEFKFSKTLASGLASLPNWAQVEVSPILDYPGYLASGSVIGEVEIPSHSFSVSGEYLKVEFDHELPKNANIRIRFSNHITSADDYEFSGNYEYLANTEFYPKISGINSVRNEINSIGADVYDDYIGALLLKNSLYLWEITGRSLNLTNPNFSAYRYVLYSTVIDIIEDKDLEKFILAGTRKRLADIDISVNPLVGRLALKLARAEKEKKKAEESLFKGWQFKTGIFNTYVETASTLNRLWFNESGYYVNPSYRFYQKNEPSSSSALNRAAKTNNPFRNYPNSGGWL